MAYGTVNTDIVSDSSGGRLAPISSVFRNRIINGAMVINQRGFSGNPSNEYTLDRWKCSTTQSAKFSVSQNAGSVTPPAGFTKYLGATSLSAYSIGSSDIFNIFQVIEGYNIADLNWGTANAKTVTLSFQVYSSLTGTFGGALRNDNANRSYPFAYTVSSANTWTTVSVTIAGDTSGTWATDNNGGIYVYFSLGTGTTYSGTAGSWAGADYRSATGATSVVGTNGATFYITGVQLEVGSSATGFEYRQYGQELTLCQRYYWKNSGANQYIRIGTGPANTTTAVLITVFMQNQMRTQPSAVTQTGGLSAWAGGTLFSVSSLSIDTTSTSPTTAVINCVTSGVSVGTTYQLIGSNDGTAAIALSAEL